LSTWRPLGLAGSLSFRAAVYGAASPGLGKTTVAMNIFAQVTMSEFSPALKAATVLGGIIALFVAIKIGQVMIRLLFGFIGLALLGGVVWWFLVRH
jgi:hypothetical protein